MALISIETWNSIANVTLNNNKFYYKLNDVWKKIEIPIGSYEITDLVKYIAQELKADHLKDPLKGDDKLRLGEEPIVLIGNHSTFKTELFCRYAVDFSQQETIGSILGFDKVVLEPFKRHEPTDTIKILLVEALNIECNLISNSFLNDKRSHDLYSCPITQPPGYKIQDIPKNLLYLPLTTREIDEIELRITDQDGKLVDLRGEFSVIRLHLRPSRDAPNI